MTKEEAKGLIEERKKLELEITSLERQKVSDMTLSRAYGKLTHLNQLYNQHRQLSEKIKIVERLAPRSEK